MKMLERVLGTTLVAVALAGCQQGGEIFRQIDLEKGSVVGGARQRLIVYQQRAEPGVPKQYVLCAEPSPDVMVAVAESFGAELSVAGKGGGGVTAARSEAAASIGIRTVTIQLLRDALYRLCESYRNGTISEFGYGLVLNSYDDIMRSLLGIEGLTRIPVAAQLAIGTTSEARAERKSTISEGAGEQGDETNREVAEEGETEAEAGATTPVTVTPGERAVVANTLTEVAGAIKSLAQRDPPHSSVVGACLMWFSVAKYDAADEHKQKLKYYCEKFLDQAVEAGNQG